ncbi:aryl-sulfate sulfotransferase [Bifidobacterium leontopitheci]|uniref:Aryl-sulfate sulfotransferase n=2 Tax=Bifidobacterium leontopitheci TaxID=2650774 RepID=A0A6I1GIN7_9BIFI|nr:aryl-sulfate sulfotransferase [Bifidobacterium leontopitheci]
MRTAAAILAVAAALSVAVFANDNISEALGTKRLARLNALVKSVYTIDYQQMADENLAKRRGDAAHGLDDIFTAANPYGTNTTSLYTYFTTGKAAKVTYTVHADGYPDFTRDAYQDKTYQTTHEFTVLGLIPGERNTITYKVTYEDGTSETRTITRTGASLLGVEEVRLEQTKQASDGTDLGDGLYAILGNDSDEQDFMYYYDTDGVLRGEIPLLYYRSHRLLFDDDGLMWFSASTKTFVGMNRLGKLEKIIDLGDRFILHHDYALDKDGNIVSLATDLKRSDHAVQDQVIKVDTSTGKVTLLADFGELLPDYKSSTTHSGIDESDPTASGRWDWIHFNTIQLLDDGSALLSARETSTIIKVNDLESDPTVAYMIGEPSVWDGTTYQSLFLSKVGDFGDTGGQHSITYVDDPTLPDGQYYLYMFDNNFGYAMTRPDFDWTVIDGISTAKSSKDKDSRSQYRRYLVDEKAGTYTEVSSFDVPYSPYVSSAQELDDGDILIDTGMQGVFGVYDADGTLLAQYKMKLSTAYIYRVYSYDFRGFYFAA